MDRNHYTATEAEAARREENWGSLTWLANQQIGNADGLTLGFVIIKEGEANPRHAHLTCEEALYLLRGRLEHTIGDQKVILEARDTLTVPAGVFHNAVNIGTEDAEMIVAYSSATRDFVLETRG
jgi:mannose-6-phosphate isomerase-like protein (cupin superfamily)